MMIFKELIVLHLYADDPPLFIKFETFERLLNSLCLRYYSDDIRPTSEGSPTDFQDSEVYV